MNKSTVIKALGGIGLAVTVAIGATASGTAADSSNPSSPAPMAPSVQDEHSAFGSQTTPTAPSTPADVLPASVQNQQLAIGIQTSPGGQATSWNQDFDQIINLVFKGGMPSAQIMSEAFRQGSYMDMAAQQMLGVQAGDPLYIQFPDYAMSKAGHAGQSGSSASTPAPAPASEPTPAPAPATTPPPAPATASNPVGPSGKLYAITDATNLRSDSNTSSRVLTLVPAGTMVGLQCKTTGQAVNGRWGTDAYWDRVTVNGTTGYLTDEYVDTRSDETNTALVPNC